MGKGIVRTSGSSGSTGASATVQTVALSGSTQPITASAPTANGQQLFVEITQSSSGGTQVTWGSTFSTNTPIDINQAANAVTLFQFVAIGSIWTFTGVVA